MLFSVANLSFTDLSAGVIAIVVAVLIAVLCSVLGFLAGALTVYCYFTRKKKNAGGRREMQDQPTTTSSEPVYDNPDEMGTNGKDMELKTKVNISYALIKK